jgi:VCBS repeat-containing protein
MSTAGQPLVFILDNVADYQSTADGLDASYEVHVLSADSDALAQMVALLDGRTGLDAIHLISHGDAGVLDLGSLSLSSANLADHSAALAALGASLSADADFLIYGCDVAEGEAGAAFVNALADATGADVAASVDVTGPAALGGDALLEYQTGDIESAALAGEALQSSLGLGDIVSGLLSYIFDSSDFQVEIHAEIADTDPDNGLSPGAKTDRFTLDNVADGTVVSVYLDTAMVGNSIQIVRDGLLLGESEEDSVDGSTTDAFLSWNFQVGDIVQATTTDRGTYSLFLGTDSGITPLANLLDSAPFVSLTQPVYDITEDGSGTGWTVNSGSLTGTLSLSNAGALDLTGLSYSIDGDAFVDDGGDLIALGQFGTLYLNAGTGGYVYAPNATAINALDSGENAVDTFTFNAVGVVGDITSGSFSFSITGSNDAPVITLDGQGATLVEASGSGNATAGKEVAHIGLFMNDPEGDVQLDTTALASDGWQLMVDPAYMSQSGLYGTVELELATGRVTYTLDNEMEATQLLNVGDQATESFYVSIVDGGGLTDRVAVSFEVSGADDTLELALEQATPAAIYIDGNGIEQTNYNRTGFLTVTDIDTPPESTGNLSFTILGGFEDDGGNFGISGQLGSLYVNSYTGQFDFVGNAAAIGRLAGGELVTDTFTLNVSDAYGVLDSSVYEVQFVGMPLVES